MIQTPAFSVSHTELRRFFRVRETVVLEVAISCPQLQLTDGENQEFTKEISRFNACYQAVAEAFVGWCEHTLAEEAREAFSAAGVGAAYTFDRRIATCRMELVPNGEGTLSVRRTATLGSRRGGVRASREQTDRWRVTDLTLMPLRKKGSRARQEGSMAFF